MKITKRNGRETPINIHGFGNYEKQRLCLKVDVYLKYKAADAGRQLVDISMF